MPPRSPTTVHAIQSHCIKNPVFPYIPWISIDFLNIEHKEAAMSCIRPYPEFDLTRGKMIMWLCEYMTNFVPVTQKM